MSQNRMYQIALCSMARQAIDENLRGKLVDFSIWCNINETSFDNTADIAMFCRNDADMVVLKEFFKDFPGTIDFIKM